MLRLSPNFTLAEFVKSATAQARGIDNSLPASLMPNAVATAEMLERIRAALGNVRMPLTSGYRCRALNTAIGSTGADHPQAHAADWSAPTYGTPYEICRFLAPLVDSLGIGQLIHEGPGASRWVHTSTQVPAKPINRILTIGPGRLVRAGIHEIA